MILYNGVTFEQGVQVGDNATAYPTYSMSVSKTTMTEDNDVVVCTVSTTGILDGTILFWSVSGTVHSSQLKVTSGYVTVNNSVAIVSVVSNPNLLADGATSFKVAIHTGSVNGPVVSTTPEISILDSSNLTSGQVLYTTPGTYIWTVPSNVYNVNVVCVGGGGSGAGGYSATGGGGGGLGWKNNIPVTPGNSYTIVVGAGGAKSVTSYQQTGNPGSDSYFISNSTVKGGGGAAGTFVSAFTGTPAAAGGTYVGDGGGNGGASGTSTGGDCTGGGGAGGYTGAGGSSGNSASNGNASNGGGGGGAGSSGYGGYAAAGGGGVGVLGLGSNGAGGTAGTNSTFGYGGSGGSNGVNGIGNSGAGTYTYGGNGGGYGGGGGSAVAEFSGAQGGAGANGAVRIIWGPNRAFPSTNTQDM